MLPPEQVDFVRRVQAMASCRLTGGTALSGVHLGHRLSRDLDLFCDESSEVRDVLRACSEVALDLEGHFSVVRDGRSFVRGTLELEECQLAVDIAHDPSDAIAPRERVEGVVVDSLADMRANKITCLLSRVEPRDLVDLYFLDRDEGPIEDALGHALQKDAGVDPGILSYLLTRFRTSPLPIMLKALEEEELIRFRDELAERFRVVGVPDAKNETD